MKCEHAGWTTRTTNMTREAPQSRSPLHQDAADNRQITDRARLVCLLDRHALSLEVLTVQLGTHGCHIWLIRHPQRTSYCSARCENGSRRSMYRSSLRRGVHSRPSTRTSTTASLKLPAALTIHLQHQAKVLSMEASSGFEVNAKQS